MTEEFKPSKTLDEFIQCLVLLILNTNVKVSVIRKETNEINNGVIKKEFKFIEKVVNGD